MSGFIALSATDNYSKAECCLCKIKFKRKKKKEKKEIDEEKKKTNECTKNTAQEPPCRALLSPALRAGGEGGDGAPLPAEWGATPPPPGAAPTALPAGSERGKRQLNSGRRSSPRTEQAAQGGGVETGSPRSTREGSALPFSQ